MAPGTDATLHRLSGRQQRGTQYNHSLLEADMITSMKPCLFIPGVGSAFAHDINLVTGAASEVMSDHPRELKPTIDRNCIPKGLQQTKLKDGRRYETARWECALKATGRMRGDAKATNSASPRLP